MKKEVFTWLLPLFLLVSCNHKESVYLKDLNSLDGLKVFVYQPPKGVYVPDSSYVTAVLQDSIIYSNLVRKGNNFEFTLKNIQETSPILFSFFDKKNNLIDSNHSKGYMFFFEDQELKLSLNEKELNKYALLLKLNNIKKIVEIDQIFRQYDSIFKLNPSLKNDNNYMDQYIFNKYIIKNEYSQDVEQYLEKILKLNTEKDFSKVIFYYQLMGQNSKVDSLTKIVCEKFPLGKINKDNFIDKVLNKPNKSVHDIYKMYAEHVKKTNDHSDYLKQKVYRRLIDLFLTNYNLDSVHKYEKLIIEKNQLKYIFNEFAWSCTGGGVFGKAQHLEFAEVIAKYAVDYAKIDMLNSKDSITDLENKLNYIGIADTYALVLYKKGNFTQAFQIQDEISKMHEIGIDGKERLMFYAEKVKGLEYTKNYIENQLNNGYSSTVLLSKLKEIYNKLKIPDTQLEEVINNYNKKLYSDIEKKFGTMEAPSFSMKNLDGNMVKLSQLKGKVVVLDFWATWCGPCKMSFPKMQSLIKEYRNKNVEFLFIDIWEKNKNNDQIETSVKTFIKDQKYTFNVLFDFDGTVSKKYKIEHIPTKIIIDKNGRIVSFDPNETNLIQIIENQLKL